MGQGTLDSDMKLQIERRASLSYAEFARDYLFANKPVVITDAIREWKAISRWTPEFFKNEFGDLRFTLNGSKKSGYKTESGVGEFTMAQFIDRVLASTDDDPAPYFRNRILHEEFPTLKEDVEPLPDYFLPNWLAESYLLKGVERLLHRGARMEIYIGGTGGTFPVLHYDGLVAHAFLAQIHGRKKFILYNPEQESYLYPKPDVTNFSRITDVEHPDLTQFPLFARAEPTIFILEPGESLFIPSKWWHTTKMLTPSISISVNVVNRSNWAGLTDLICGVQSPRAQLPVRIYLSLSGAWRSMRDWRRNASAAHR